MKTRSVCAVLLCLFVLAGCAGHTAEGYVQIPDSSRLQAAGGTLAMLKPGPATLEFGTKPVMFANEVVLESGTTRFEGKVPKAAYTDNSFQIKGHDNALPFDLSVAWTERRGEQITRDERAECQGPGFCEGPVSRSYCGTDASGRQACRTETRYEYGYFYNCPGVKSVRNVYQVYRYGVIANLFDPLSNAVALATFRGQTTANERLLRTEREGMCQSR